MAKVRSRKISVVEQDDLNVPASPNVISDLVIASTADSASKRLKADIVIDLKDGEIDSYQNGTAEDLLAIAVKELLRLRRQHPVSMDDARLPDAIVRLSQAAESLFDSGLTKRAIIVLLHDSCRTVTRKQINEVLDALPTLRKNYVINEKRPG